MSKPIRKVAVLGSGVMGGGIAAHLANAGIPVLLLDIVPPKLTDAERASRRRATHRRRRPGQAEEGQARRRSATCATPR
jgi:3-hydroxyacyl-CoA dehydrogenase